MGEPVRVLGLGIDAEGAGTGVVIARDMRGVIDFVRREDALASLPGLAELDELAVRIEDPGGHTNRPDFVVSFHSSVDSGPPYELQIPA